MKKDEVIILSCSKCGAMSHAIKNPKNVGWLQSQRIRVCNLQDLFWRIKMICKKCDKIFHTYERTSRYWDGFCKICFGELK